MGHKSGVVEMDVAQDDSLDGRVAVGQAGDRRAMLAGGHGVKRQAKVEHETASVVFELDAAATDGVGPAVNAGAHR